MPGGLLYEQPSFIHLLVLGSFLYLVNVARIVADYLFYAGLVAEIALGTIYGSPLANILPLDWQPTFTAVGYFGLILVVFEGGLTTNLPVLLSNLPLSIVCALTGIAAPIALSFALLQAGFGYEPLEAFAAGAALSSTSLGTTLAALNSVTKHTTAISVSDPSLLDDLTTRSASDTDPATPTLPREKETLLQQSRIGTILISAAIIDDVIGLVIASLIPALASVDSNVPNDNHGNLAWTIVRPLLSSFLIAVIASFVSRFVLRPVFLYQGVGERWCAPTREGKPWGASALSKESSGWGTSAHSDAVKLFIMVITLSGMAAIANYTDTSVLYGAYIAGLILTYISQPSPGEGTGNAANELSFEQTFSRTIVPLQAYLFLPLFFASIGFAIPFLNLWHPTVIWRGLVYSVLMALAKLAVGIPILLYPVGLSFAHMAHKNLRRLVSQLGVKISGFLRTVIPRLIGRRRLHSKPLPPGPMDQADSEKVHSHADTPQHPPIHQESTLGQLTTSIPASVFMGIAMVSRGEIGLLIAQLARGTDSNGEKGLLGDEAFLVCIWAILLCTLVGPIGTGIVVRRWGPRVTSGLWA
ncbi:hypothetical protein GSI_00265 [Ganoderma sinense ZZ0214-1]|uniref:Cation/H+ exchanger transmembrane domain-containing protein n=1 Tax=Ganoderma sinense ZZ0214-1 TaxID=1077348 RepID=A0A2G8SS27_9APHY|nr:hypothetical protein GSI_00265 [Ganoderma sinense ZZ0214-1]